MLWSAKGLKIETMKNELEVLFVCSLITEKSIENVRMSQFQGENFYNVESIDCDKVINIPVLFKRYRYIKENVKLRNKIKFFHISIFPDLQRHCPQLSMHSRHSVLTLLNLMSTTMEKES